MKKYLTGKLSRNTLVIILCILGVIASAAWTSSVGHMSNKAVPLSPQPAGYYNTYTSAQTPVSSSGAPISGASQTGVQTGSASGTAAQPATNEPDVLYPVDPPPCKTYVNGKAYCVYCDNSVSSSDVMPCGGCYGGGGIHPEIMCPY